MIIDDKQVLEFTNASAGMVKTYTLNTFITRMLLTKKQVVYHALTGIATIILLNGCNFHSYFNASRYPDVVRGLKINKNTRIASDFLKTEVLVIYTATQLHKNSTDDLNEKLNDLKKYKLPFVGITIVLSGDFKHTLPIVILCHQLDQIGVYIKTSPLQNLFKDIQCSFTTNMMLQQVTNIENHEELEKLQRSLPDIGLGNTYKNCDGNIRLT